MGTVKIKLQFKLALDKLEEDLKDAKELYKKYKTDLKRKNNESSESETKISVIGIGKVEKIIDTYTFNQTIIPKIEEFIKKNKDKNRNTEDLSKIKEYSDMLKTFTDAIEVREMPKTNASSIFDRVMKAIGGR